MQSYVHVFAVSNIHTMANLPHDAKYVTKALADTYGWSHQHDFRMYC